MTNSRLLVYPRSNRCSSNSYRTKNQPTFTQHKEWTNHE